eukprot:TRINITY_DN17_c1_g1_i1.p1 TRINITY_DN17_c1_g1~~TRINITY_DN17_c1_g1_i1.p1  ORF type:complete len:314 (+),score=70.61 TRINITY_DN17_c1_g1_i1:98-1039(+)
MVTLRANAPVFVPAGLSGVSATRTVPAEAVGDLLIKDLATRLQELNATATARTRPASTTSRWTSARPDAKRESSKRRQARSGWQQLPASGLFCPCCAALRSCPFHKAADAVPLSRHEVEALRQRPAVTELPLREETPEPRKPKGCPTILRRPKHNMLPPPPTTAPPPPPPPGLEVPQKTVAKKKQQHSPSATQTSTNDMLLECGANSIPRFLLDDASTEVSNADSEVSSSLSFLSSKTRARQPQQQEQQQQQQQQRSQQRPQQPPPQPRPQPEEAHYTTRPPRGVWAARSRDNLEMERLPYRSAVWSNSKQRQ